MHHLAFNPAGEGVCWRAGGGGQKEWGGGGGTGRLSREAMAAC